MTAVAVVNETGNPALDSKIAFWVKGSNEQVIDCAVDWGVTPTPAVFYSTPHGLPARECRIMSIVKDVGVPGATGFHDVILGIVYGKVQDGPEASATIDHEDLEQLIDPLCNQWRKMPDGRWVALEVCDPVQGDVLNRVVSIFGETRHVQLSNYVLPSWFEASGKYPYDALGVLTAPFSMSPGGWMLVRDNGSKESYPVFASDKPDGTHPGKREALAKLARPGSRMRRRLVTDNG